MNRRGFLGGLIVALAAPAIIRPGLLMPVKPFSLVTHTVSNNLPTVEGYPGSTWQFVRGARRVSLQASVSGLWLPTSALPPPESPWCPHVGGRDFDPEFVKAGYTGIDESLPLEIVEARADLAGVIYDHRLDVLEDRFARSIRETVGPPPPIREWTDLTD